METSWKILGVRQLLEELQADAELGRLVRGMRRGSTLLHTTDCKNRPDWVASWSGGGGCIITNSGSDDPTVALRSIQRKEEDDAYTDT